TRLADALERFRAETERGLDELARRASVQEARLTLAETAGSSGVRERPAGTSSAPAAVPALPAGVYALFEERFRGSPAEIARGQRDYLKLLAGIPGPVLDVGCGRGEFLKLLSETGLSGSGIESNPVSAAACRAAGLEVEEADALEALGR